MADPGFPSYTRCQHQGEGGCANLSFFGHCFLKTMKLKRNVSPPLDPPMVCLIAQFESLLLHVHHVMYFYSPPTKSGVCVCLSVCITNEGVSHVTITHDVLELTIKRSPRADIWLREGIVFSQMCVHLCTGGVMYWNTPYRDPRTSLYWNTTTTTPMLTSGGY